jgi:lipid A 3-O-deacylase
MQTMFEHPLLKKSVRAGALAAVILGLGVTAHAQAAPGPLRSVYIQAGDAQHGTDSATVGVTFPWDWPHNAWGGGFEGYWDLFASRWSVDDSRPGPRHYTVIGAKPVVRYRFDGGRSGWFSELGIGASVADERYQTDHERFGTRFNFASHLGVGYSFGEQRRHEVALRYEHYSNGGIKKPNPGENFAQLRYAYRF